MRRKIADLIKRMLNGDRLALARILTLVENESPDLIQIMQSVQGAAKNGYYVGVTGPPGSGKSTLVDKLTLQMRGTGANVGIVAIDPSSPFSGGAILGDRIRMQRHALDSGVYIRSLATRGNLGGLARATKNCSRVLNAFGTTYCIIETVGVGQVELDIVDTADTTIVVLMPQTGDSIQAIKAGILEIADILVVNKADIKGADKLIADLEIMLEENQRFNWWRVPIIATQASKNVGIKDLFEKIEDHKRTLRETGQYILRRRNRNIKEMVEIITRKINKGFIEQQDENEDYQKIVQEVMLGTMDPYSAAMAVLRNPNIMLPCLRKASEDYE